MPSATPSGPAGLVAKGRGLPSAHLERAAHVCQDCSHEISLASCCTLLGSVAQTDLCRLDAIRYNLVGRLDSLQKDTAKLLRILTRHTGRNASAHAHVLGFGHSVHRTRADQQLKAYYDKVRTPLRYCRRVQHSRRNHCNGFEKLWLWEGEVLVPNSLEKSSSEKEPVGFERELYCRRVEYCVVVERKATTARLAFSLARLEEQPVQYKV